MIAIRRILLALGAVIVIALVVAIVAAVHYRLDRAIQVATSSIAKTLCSAAFVSNLDPDQLYREALQPSPGIRRLNRGIRYNVDRLRKEVTADFFGMLEGYAVFRGETGCIVAHENEYIAPIMDATKNEVIAPLLPDIGDQQTIEPANDRLRAALDRAFDATDRGSHRWTKAIVVLHNGKIIGERYAPGINVDTKMPGYSMSKSVVNAMVGILVKQGKLTVDGPAPVGEWKEASDPRHAISIENLMRMTSGLDLDETSSGFDPSEQIQYLEGDMAGAAVRAKMIAPPGMRWHYSSPSTLIVCRIVKGTVGGQADSVLQFARRELFAPLGIKTMTMEFDGAGTPVGSTYFFASTRDWARFGQLYLRDGGVGGNLILPEG